MPDFPAVPDAPDMSDAPCAHADVLLKQALSPPGATRASRARLYLMTASDFGLSFSWIVKYAVTSPVFLHRLHAGPVVSHLVWILGPASGLLTAPVVGVLSDRCGSRWGRRRPFMAAGALASVCGMLLFAEAGSLPARARVPVAVFAFGVLDFAANVVMFPSRALLGDLLPPDQQHDAQSAAAVLASVAEIAAGAFLFALHRPLDYLRGVFGLASVVLLATTAVSLAACGERQFVGRAPHVEMEDMAGRDATEETDEVALDVEMADLARGGRLSETDTVAPEKDQVVEAVGRPPGAARALTDTDASYAPVDEAPKRPCGVLRDIVAMVHDAIVNYPRPLVRVGVAYGLAWMCWFACLPYLSAWIGTDVVGGSSSAPAGSAGALRFQRGVNVFAGASVAKAVVSMAFSASYPVILRGLGAAGERVIFSVPFAVFGAALGALAGTRAEWVAAGVVVLAAVPFVATQTIPVAILVQRFPDRLASNLGVMNLFCVVPQLIDTLYTGALAARFTETAVMRAAAAWALVTAAVSFWLL